MVEITQFPLSVAYAKFSVERSLVMAYAEQFLTPTVMNHFPALKSKIDSVVRLFSTQHEKLKEAAKEPELFLKGLATKQLLSHNLSRAIGYSINDSTQRGELCANVLAKNIDSITLIDLQNLPLKSEEHKMEVVAAIIVAQVLRKAAQIEEPVVSLPLPKRQHFQGPTLGPRTVFSSAGPRLTAASP